MLLHVASSKKEHSLGIELMTSLPMLRGYEGYTSWGSLIVTTYVAFLFSGVFGIICAYYIDKSCDVQTTIY